MGPCVYFLYLSHLLFGICVNIFIMNRYISKSCTRSKNTIYRAGEAVVSTFTSKEKCNVTPPFTSLKTRKTWAELTFAKTSGTVTRNKKKHMLGQRSLFSPLHPEPPPPRAWSQASRRQEWRCMPLSLKGKIFSPVHILSLTLPSQDIWLLTLQSVKTIIY